MRLIKILILGVILLIFYNITLNGKPKIVKKEVTVINGKIAVMYYVDSDGINGWDCKYGYYDGKLVYIKINREAKESVEDFQFFNSELKVEISNRNININFNNSEKLLNLKLELWDITGKKVDDVLINQNIFQYYIKDNYNSGIYFIAVVNDYTVLKINKILIAN